MNLVKYFPVLIFIIVVLIFSCSSEKADKTNSAASKIITALERHKADMGYYPETLKSLIPKYLDKIPTTFYGDRNNEFHYLLSSSTDSTDVEYYELWFFAPLGVEVRYNGLTENWQYDD